MLLFELLEPAACQVVDYTFLVAAGTSKEFGVFHDLLILHLKPTLLLPPDVVAQCSIEIGMLAFSPFDRGMFRICLPLQVLVLVTQHLGHGAANDELAIEVRHKTFHTDVAYLLSTPNFAPISACLVPGLSSKYWHMARFCSVLSVLRALSDGGCGAGGAWAGVAGAAGGGGALGVSTGVALDTGGMDNGGAE